MQISARVVQRAHFQDFEEIVFSISILEGVLAAYRKAGRGGRAVSEIIIHVMPDPAQTDFYCPTCSKAVADPLICGDCHSVICRQCGTVLERIDDLGIG
jgi:hypothetical protein